LLLALAATGLTGSFAVEITGEMETHGKPDPETYLLEANCLGVPPAACVVLEGAPNEIAAAAAAGMRSLAVPHVYTRELRFAPPPAAILPDLHAAIPWLRTQGVDRSERALTGQYRFIP
jgi:beta-phosphoglucomutase-like phosphatase (HAD superfamily)